MKFSGMVISNLLRASLFSTFLAGPALAESNISNYFQLGLDNVSNFSQSAEDEGFNSASQTQLGKENLASIVQSASEQGLNLGFQTQIGNSLTAMMDLQATGNLPSINIQIQTGTDNFSYMAP